MHVSRPARRTSIDKPTCWWLATAPQHDEELLRSSQAVTFSSLLLFHGITHTKHGEELRSAGSLRYSRMRELLVAKLRELGFDTKNFGLDSLQAGGTTAAANAGVTEEVLMSSPAV